MQELDRAMDLLREITIEGLQHGFFEASVVVDMANSKKRSLLIKSGKSYKFVIAVDELPRK